MVATGLMHDRRTRQLRRRSWLSAPLTVALMLWPGGAAPAADAIELEGVVTLLAEIQVPAREPGVLDKLHVQPGAAVEPGQLLAQLDDRRAQLLVAQARIDLEQSRRQAENDLQVREARKAHEIAQAELQRATDSAARFAKSVSQTELDRLRLTTEKAALTVEQAEFDLQTRRLAVQAKDVACQLAEHELDRRRIEAPAAGMVLEILRRDGEWVEPGQPLLRLVQIDRLRVEGFLPAGQATAKLVGRPVTITLRLAADDVIQRAATLTFVSPEIHPVNGMVRVWAELENADGQLRPGLPATMQIQP